MKLYLVTGTTKGLGAALRDELAKNPTNEVVCISRAAERLSPPLNFFADFADIASVQSAFAKIETQMSDREFAQAVLINNAGVIDPIGPHFQNDAKALANNLQVNLLAPMVLTMLFAQTRLKLGEKLVINISSGAARRPIAGWSAYCAAKAGLEMATKVAAMEAPVGLTICSLAPGVIDTPMQERVRGVEASDFPDVGRFRALKADGALRDAHAVARDILKLIAGGQFANGGNFDIREMTI